MEIEVNVVSRALDVLDTAVVVLSADRRTSLYSNAAARKLIGSSLPASLREAIERYVSARRTLRRLPPPVSVRVGRERAFYLRVVPSGGAPRLEIVVLRERLKRDVDLFRRLQARYRVTRREFQILNALRRGKTNREIGFELELAEGTIARHLHRLLERFSVSNRASLVHAVDELAASTD